MSLVLPPRRQEQLKQKVASLRDATFASWLKKSEKGGVFQIHNSQMQALSKMMAVLSDALEASGAKATPATAPVVEQDILRIFQTWEFFRAKLAQRLEPEIQPFLRICDELAWKCYEPFRNAAGVTPATKEPPLVFLASDVSPFIKERSLTESTYAPSSITEKIGFQAALDNMPFPVIGVPWYQVDYLPDALVICHEVGHAIELDFRLETRLDELLDAAVVHQGRQGVWKSWRREVFADTIGCLAAGPCFAWTLADFLFTERSVVMMPRKTYPSHFLRILYCCTVLRTMAKGRPNELKTEADGLEAWWRESFTGSHAFEAFEDDRDSIASKLLGETFDVFGRKRLGEILRFTALDQLTVEDAALKALGTEKLTVSDIRLGVASSRAAFARDPIKYYEKSSTGDNTPQQSLIEHLIRNACRNDLRSRGSNEQEQQRLDHIEQSTRDISVQLLGSISA